MSRLVALFAVTVVSVGTAIPQEGSGAERRTEVALEFGYFSPAKEAFRLNYDQRLAFGSASVPVSLGVEIDRPVFEAMDLFLNIRRINHRLKSNDNISLALMPLTLGVRYVVPKRVLNISGLTPYFGAGIELYWSRFSAEYFVTDVSPDVINVASSSEDYFGYGFTMGLGAEHPFGDLVSGSLGVSYDVSRLGSSAEGGLGNVGGFLFSAKIGFNF